MDTITKLKKKKKLKILNIIYQSFTISSIICFVLLLIAVCYKKNEINRDYVTYCAVFVLIILTSGLLSGAFAQIISGDLTSYKLRIKAYRARKHLNVIIKLMDDKEYQKAIDMYNSMNNSNIKDFLYPYLLGVLITCDDPKRVENATENRQETLDRFSPDDIFN